MPPELATPAPTRVNTSPAPSATPTPVATKIAEIEEKTIGIAINSPGNGSQVTSPIVLQAELQPGADGRVLVELSDVAGRLLARQILEFAGGELELTLPFEVSRPPLPARLTLRTLDAYGRVQAMSSVELTLLAEGRATLLPAASQPGLTIEQPMAGQQLSGANLTISGTAQLATTQPLSLQLITREGRVLVAREVYVEDGRFETTLRLDVNEPTWLQVAVTAFGRQVPGASYFAGVEILVLP